MRRPSPLPERPASRPRATPDVSQQDDAEDSGEQVDPIDSAAASVSEDRAKPERERGALREVWRASRARRKVMRQEVKRFTVRARRRRWIWIASLSALALLIIGSFGAAYSPLFAVEQVSVTGTSTLSADDVEAALAGQKGTPLAAVNANTVKAALVAFPLIESYSIEARPPHELVVNIVERTPVGVVQSDAGYTLVDAAGVALSTSEAVPDGQPVIDAEGGVGSKAFLAAGHVIRAIPESIRSQVVSVTATTPDDVTFTLRDSNAVVVWGSADDSVMKAQVLAKAMIPRPPTDGLTYDVSSSKVIVIG